MTLGILQCDSVRSELVPRFGDYPEMFRALFERVTTGIRYRSYDLTRTVFPDAVDDCDAWLMTGSKWSVYDDGSWIRQAARLAMDIHGAGRPLVGICFGHQLIAEALGGRVQRSERGWGVGAHTTKIERPVDWMKPERTGLTLVVSHRDQVTELPSGAERLAGHPFCENDIVQIGRTTLTFQAHPEFSAEYARALMDIRRDVIGETAYVEGMHSLAEPTDEQVAASWILEFIRTRI